MVVLHLLVEVLVLLVVLLHLFLLLLCHFGWIHANLEVWQPQSTAHQLVLLRHLGKVARGPLGGAYGNYRSHEGFGLRLF